MEVDEQVEQLSAVVEKDAAESNDRKKTKPLCNGNHEESSLDDAPADAVTKADRLNGSAKMEGDSKPPAEEHSTPNGCSDSNKENEGKHNAETEKGSEVGEDDKGTDNRSRQDSKVDDDTSAVESKESNKVKASEGDSRPNVNETDADSAVEITDTPVKERPSSSQENAGGGSEKDKSESSVIVVWSTSGSATATPGSNTSGNTPRTATPTARSTRTGTPTPAGRSSRTGTPVNTKASSRTATPVDTQVCSQTATPAKGATAGGEKTENTPAVEKNAKKSKVSQVLDQTSRAAENFRPIAQMLFDIGMDITRQNVYKDLIKIQRKKQSMGKLDDKEKVQLGKLEVAYDELISKNELYINDLKSCKHCSFKTDSENVLSCHLEYAHDQHIGLFTCVLCNSTLPTAAQFLYHMDSEHQRRGRVYMKHAFFVCPNCPYESNMRAHFSKHTEKCNKNFNARQNLIPLAPDRDIPLLAPRAPMKAAPKTPVSKTKPVAPPRPLVPRPAVRTQSPQVRPGFISHPTPPRLVTPPRPVNTKQAPRVAQPPRPAVVAQARPRAPVASGPSPTAQVGPGGVPLVQMNGQFYKLAVVGTQQFLVPVSDPSTVQKSTQQKTPPPIVVQANSKAAVEAGVKQKPKISDHLQALKEGKGRDYEICEICGGFVKDKENLRIHFLWAHKVDIHRDVFKKGVPPLVCSVCPNSNERFWTYQGLARHRQEGHKLITTPKHAVMKKLIDEIAKKCIYCLETFSSNIDARGYWAHMVIHGITPASIFRTNKCCACGAIIQDRSKMKLHLRTRHALLFSKVEVHNNQVPKSVPANTPTVKPANKAQIAEKRCANCSFKTVIKEALNKHIATVHPYKCSRCRLRFDEVDSVHQHFSTVHSQEKDECPLCKVNIKVGRAFVRHVKSEHMKECSVVVRRLRKDVLEEREVELQRLLAEIAATKKTPNKRKRAPPQKVEKEKVIVLDEDSPPRKKQRPETEVKNGKEILEVDGEEIVVEIQQDDDEDDEMPLKISSSQSLAETPSKCGDNVESDEMGLKITSTHSLSGNADVPRSGDSRKDETDSSTKMSSQSSPAEDEAASNKSVAKSQACESDRIVITDSSEMNDSQEVITLDESRDSVKVPTDDNEREESPVCVDSKTTSEGEKDSKCDSPVQNEMDTS